LRAGLFSNPKIIKLINERFVATWIVKDALEIRAKHGDKFARNVDAQLAYPIMDLIFATPSGQYINKLNAFQDFLDVHPDVSVPRSARKRRETIQSDVQVFLDHVATLLGENAP
jgi:hypothetical protein